jgi:F0F1-type ATP synthase membrane subunit b/b'
MAFVKGLMYYIVYNRIKKALKAREGVKTIAKTLTKAVVS